MIAPLSDDQTSLRARVVYSIFNPSLGRKYRSLYLYVFTCHNIISIFPIIFPFRPPLPSFVHFPDAVRFILFLWRFS